MSTLDDWITEATAALGLPADSVPTPVRDQLLDVTRDVAHGVTRIAGPLTCYLIGIAVGRGADPSTAAAAVGAVLPLDEATAAAEAEHHGHHHHGPDGH